MISVLDAGRCQSACMSVFSSRKVFGGVDVEDAQFNSTTCASDFSKLSGTLRKMPGSSSEHEDDDAQGRNDDSDRDGEDMDQDDQQDAEEGEGEGDAEAGSQTTEDDVPEGAGAIPPPRSPSPVAPIPADPPAAPPTQPVGRPRPQYKLKFTMHGS